MTTPAPVSVPAQPATLRTALVAVTCALAAYVVLLAALENFSPFETVDLFAALYESVLGISFGMLAAAAGAFLGGAAALVERLDARTGRPWPVPSHGRPGAVAVAWSLGVVLICSTVAADLVTWSLDAYGYGFLGAALYSVAGLAALRDRRRLTS